MTGKPVSQAAMEAAWAADLAWLHSPDRERGGSWGTVQRAQLQRLLNGAAPVIIAEDRAALRACAKAAAVPAWLPTTGEHTLGGMNMNVVPLDGLLGLLDDFNGPPEDPMTDAGVITVRFPDGTDKRYRADSFSVDDDGNLTVSAGSRKVAWFPAGSHWGACEEDLKPPVITERQGA